MQSAFLVRFWRRGALFATEPLDAVIGRLERMWRAFREDYFAVPDILARKKEFVICRHVERNFSASSATHGD
jgi:hypothetical protein